jgi:hypothetical protein
MAQVAIKGNNFLFSTKTEGYYFVVVFNSPFGNNRIIRKLLGWTWTLLVWFIADETDECWRSKHLLTYCEVSTYSPKSKLALTYLNFRDEMQKRPESKTIAGLSKSLQTILLAGALVPIYMLQESYTTNALHTLYQP